MSRSFSFLKLKLKKKKFICSTLLTSVIEFVLHGLLWWLNLKIVTSPKRSVPTNLPCVKRADICTADETLRK